MAMSYKSMKLLLFQWLPEVLKIGGMTVLYDLQTSQSTKKDV